MGLVRITNLNGRHFVLPPSEIHRMTGLPPKIRRRVNYDVFAKAPSQTPAMALRIKLYEEKRTLALKLMMARVVFGVQMTCWWRWNVLAVARLQGSDSQGKMMAYNWEVRGWTFSSEVRHSEDMCSQMWHDPQRSKGVNKSVRFRSSSFRVKFLHSVRMIA